MSGERSNHETDASGCDAAQPPLKTTDLHSPVTLGQSPFLTVPAEIRNHIYRLLLLTENVITYGLRPGQGSSNTVPTQTAELAIGTVRCRSSRPCTLEYQTSLLGVNRQIRDEAWGIFQLENFWTIVSINKTRFGEQLKDRGFPIATGRDIKCHIISPVMTMKVKFSSLEDQAQNDVLVFESAHLKEVMRAFWTAKGASEMEVLLHMPTPPTNKSPSRRDLLQPLHRLRCVKRVAAWSSISEHYVEVVAPDAAVTDVIDENMAELIAGIYTLSQHIQQKKWHDALAQAEDNSNFMNDNQLVFDSRLSGVKLGVDAATARARRPAAKHVMVANALTIAEMALYRKQFLNAVRFVNLALRVFPDLPFPGDDDEAHSIPFLFLAQAHMGMNQPEPAWDDIQRARELAPDSAELASMEREWLEKFGPRMPKEEGKMGGETILFA